MRTLNYLGLLLAICLFIPVEGMAQRRKKNTTTLNASLADSVFSGLKLRNIGPAIKSGRIADIAIHPENDNIWYVAVGSGGVWKTENSGTTWKPIFDKQKVYSIGCVTIDPNNPNTIWVGTGENVGGRHVAFGDGVYKSTDGGAKWSHMGLPTSEHISKILVHPENPDIVWVASQGPLWKKGGERGLYKTVDGGKSWKRTLGDDTWVGVTELVSDPRNPDILYAATWQRHRTVAAYMGGGPGSGLHKSIDGGETWTALKKGLPTSWMGKIGLAISPQNPDVLYAAIELDRRSGAVYRSTDRGASWEKRSNAVSGATGPHYYQELYASPHQFDKIYLVDVRMQVSEDGGKSFSRMREESKHSDNHALAFKKDDPNYLMIGTDGGIYETFDDTKNWRFIENLPVTQFYKVALDDSTPFYNIYGGTQDNGTQGGPSRTASVNGIQNSDWKIVLNWDGHQPATEPGNPNIMYAERQEGTLSRIDLATGEVMDIQPQPGKDETFERFNWDAPILVSQNTPSTIYFASQRVWKSTNRGDSWTALSGDLTRNQNRFEMPIMGKKQSWDAPWDMLAMSNYNSITSLAVSPLNEQIIYAGTDDGLIQASTDGGANWRRIEVGSISGIPATAFVNDIKADLYDANTLYVALDNHKYGDFKPYLVKSSDNGRTWTKITGNLPRIGMVWRMVQDHVKKDLLFTATEFGMYFSVNGGQQWTKLGGAPTIAFRDLAIQKRENDLVGASFGRGFFVLDDYSALRDIDAQSLQQEAMLFKPRDAWWYIEKPNLSFEGLRGDMGASHYVAPNPTFGVNFTYYLKEGLKSKKENRKAAEKKLGNGNIAFPGWDALAEETTASPPLLLLAISDAQGKVVRKISAKPKAGINRINWDLRHPSPALIRLQAAHGNDHDGPSAGFLAAPGQYTAQLYSVVDGKPTSISESVSFQLKPLFEGSLPGANIEDVTAFWRNYEATAQRSEKLESAINNQLNRAKAMEKSAQSAQIGPGELENKSYTLVQAAKKLQSDYNGDPNKTQVGEKTKPTVGGRLFSLLIGLERSTYGPTATHKKSMEIVQSELASFEGRLQHLKNQASALESELQNAGAPLIEE
ncbi:glycosyl hydrolase [Sediminicola luteus]|uniref:Glycosyl hydrolase n=1 Tax=Sediminicola luteus TaxID=319238 RepID=A0A2A4G7Q7_9FLAO|nr:glycosyl hydrolase [Sediminicola luteus]PCE63994.1 glycosyl hydrolase [Sediminicola luteus]